MGMFGLNIDNMIYVWIAIGLTFGWFLASQWLVPWKKATFLRGLNKKNYELAAVRKGGGQIKWSLVTRDQLPMMKTSKNETFIPNDQISNWIGSVRVHFFNDDDVNELNLSREKIDEVVRNPKHLDAFFMIAKAFYEALASRKQQMLLYLCIGACLAGVAAAVLSYQNMQALNAINPKLDIIVNQTVQHLVNQI